MRSGPTGGIRAVLTIRSMSAAHLIAGLAAIAAAILSGTVTLAPASAEQSWTRDELATIRSLWIGSLGELPRDPSNRVADDPRAATLGHRLFFDTRLSSNGKVSCATCHLPDRNFQDGIPLGEGVGRTPRRTMPVAGTAYSAWMFWDGRSDSQWSQALGPLESAVEHGGDRTQYAHLIAEVYRMEYEAIFGELPELRGLPRRAGPVSDSARARAWRSIPASGRDEVTRIYANIGKAIAAYERRIQYGESRFDRYAESVLTGKSPEGDATLTEDERAGLRLFIGKGSCVNCHNGSLFTDDSFHNTGIGEVAGLPRDLGRAQGVVELLASEFNCLGPYSDALPSECGELRFLQNEGGELVRAFKSPSLRNIAERAPYMHAGQLATLREVLDHYNKAPRAPAGVTELRRLRLSERELRQLEAFLRTLSGPLSAPEGFLERPPK